MNFQLKHADTGHSQIIKLDRVIKGEELMNHIGSMYKINPKDQLLITKIGHIIQPKQFLDKVFTQDLDDKTLASGLNANMRVSCIFLFDLKQLSKPEEVSEIKSKTYWQEELKQKLINLNNQSSIAFPFEALKESYNEQHLQKYEKFVYRINALKGSYIKLANQYSSMKQYCFNVEQVWERCKNQKKAGYTLIKSIKQEAYVLRDKITQSINLKQSLKSKFAIDDKSLRQNSGFFQSKKKNENSVSLYESQLQSQNSSYGAFAKKYKQYSHIWKKQLTHIESSDIEFGQKKFNEKLERCHDLIKKDYDEILILFNQLVHSNGSIQSRNLLQVKLQKSQQGITSYLPLEYSEMCEQIINYYCQYNRINQDVKVRIKNLMLYYSQSTRQISSHYKTVVSIGNAIKAEIEHQNKRKLSIVNKKVESGLREISQRHQSYEKTNVQQAQITRRIRFKKILNSLQSLSSKICLQEQFLRKKFVNQVKGNQKYEYECLKNVKVPELDLQDNSSSDLQLMKVYSPSNDISLKQVDLIPQQFMVFSFNLVLQKIKVINAADNSSKVKNLQQILKRMSDVFTKVYNKKVNDLINQKESVNQKIPQLEQKISSLQSQLENNRYEIIQLTRRLSQKQDKLILREKQRSEQINKERSKYEKLLSDFKSLEKTLSKQTKVNEQLYNQILKGQDQLKDSVQLNQYLKQLLAQKEIQIIQIQKKLQQTEKPEKDVIEASENDLKYAVMHNFSKDWNESQKDKQIERLNQQIVLLQQENEEIQQQYQKLSAQMRKMFKQTQDIQIQVNTEDPILKTLINDGIRISQQISIGQNALFMPFSNSVYVGVNHKDDDRTLCNISNMQAHHYLLDFSDFNSKTKELLSQCSFLIVLHVTSIQKQGKNMMVRGHIRHIFGFEDDNTAIKNYASLLPL